MLKIIVFLFLFIALIQAAELNYIMALKPPVTKKVVEQATKDVEAAGGKVLLELKAAIKALLIELPSQQVYTFSQKSYVDFIEPDKSVHIY